MASSVDPDDLEAHGLGGRVGARRHSSRAHPVVRRRSIWPACEQLRNLRMHALRPKRSILHGDSRSRPRGGAAPSVCSNRRCAGQGPGSPCADRHTTPAPPPTSLVVGPIGLAVADHPMTSSGLGRVAVEQKRRGTSLCLASSSSRSEQRGSSASTSCPPTARWSPRVRPTTPKPRPWAAFGPSGVWLASDTDYASQGLRWQLSAGPARGDGARPPEERSQSGHQQYRPKYLSDGVLGRLPEPSEHLVQATGALSSAARVVGISGGRRPIRWPSGGRIECLHAGSRSADDGLGRRLHLPSPFATSYDHPCPSWRTTIRCRARRRPGSSG